MSLFKFVLVLAVIIAAAFFGLSKLREKGTATSVLGMAPAASGRLSGEPAISSTNSAALGPSGVITLANDPRRVAPVQQFASSSPIDPERAKLYQAALDTIELDGCNANGTFVVRLKGERIPRIVKNGATIDLPGGLRVALRMHGYPACKVDLYDGKIAIGEVAGF